MNEPSNCYEDVIKSNGLRVDQKIAIAVLKLSLQDIARILIKKKRTMWDRENLKSALTLLLKDNKWLDFWCTIAGWDGRKVREYSWKAVRDVMAGKKLVGLKRGYVGHKNKADNLVSKHGIYIRGWREKRRAQGMKCQYSKEKESD